MLTEMAPVAVSAEWGRIRRLIGPAVGRDPKYSMVDLFLALMMGRLTCWRGPRGYIVTQTGKSAFWIIYAAGKNIGVKTMRLLMRELERIALRLGCTEVRFEGRDWRRVLPDYEAAKRPDGRMEFRKAI